MNRNVLFLSKDASWQRYRNEVLTKLTLNYYCKIDVITDSEIKDYIKPCANLSYICSTDILKWSKRINLLPYAYKYIIQYKPDVILALPNSSNLTELSLSLFCKITKTKLVYWTHGYDHCRRPDSGLNGFLNKIRVSVINKCLKQANAIIVFSEPGKEYLVDKGIDKEKIFVAPNTLNTEKLINSYLPIKEEDINKFKSDNNIENKTVYLFSGRFRSGKRLENFINALGKAKNKDSVALVVVGDGEMRESWQELCKCFGIHALFLGEVFDEDRLAIIFKSADWFVMPGYVGLAIVHAFSAGLPLLSEDISFHSPEINFLKQNVNGVLFKEKDLSAWTAFIEEKGNDFQLKNRMSKEALNTVHNEASINNQILAMSLALGLDRNV
ncbi:glycosyltransferase family 4 protein [Vibrio anguillarum]|uniref:glycosyltransferase family 4 protein n=1 Tax=Vibrio anguillarum TaxID=55601 RepID=UPI00188B7377|nr:glycosyltransferase family 4 protein [Vibrio anguillarum]MBF4400039.1 glycosyltransferase [Vibrio anguillarum]